jgi:hypothetical protein
MSKASRCRSIWDPVKRNDCYQKQEDLANKDTDIYGLNKYTKNIDRNSPLAKMSFQELLQHAKTHLGGKSRKRNILKSKSKKLSHRKKTSKRNYKLKKKKGI